MGKEGKAQRIGAVGLDAVFKFLFGRLGNRFGLLGLHHVAGALFQQRVQADAVDQVDGVQHVALGLGHLLALAIAHQAVDVNGLEGDFTGKFQRHHDHPGDPEEDDVETRHQHAGGVEGFQLRRFLRPAEGAKCPQARAEPGVQHVFVLGQGDVRIKTMLLAGFLFTASHVNIAVGVVPSRNAVAPPQLARNTPVLQVAHPGEVHVLVVFRHELNVAVLHRLDGGLGEALHGNEPLISEQRLDDIAGAVAVGQGVVDALYLYQQAEGLHIGDDLLACFETIQARVFGRQGSVFIGLRLTFQVKNFRLLKNRRIFGEDVDQQVVLALADFVVVEVVGRGNLHTARAFLHIGVLVRHDGNAATHQRQFDKFAH